MQFGRITSNGMVDDLRFYDSSLSESEISEIYNDDLTNVELAASKKQVIYDRELMIQVFP